MKKCDKELVVLDNAKKNAHFHKTMMDEYVTQAYQTSMKISHLLW